MLAEGITRSVLKVQRLVRGRREDLGSCFCVQVYSDKPSGRFSYYATASHVVASELLSGRPLFLVAWDERDIVAEVVVAGDSPDRDVAVLRSAVQADIPSLICCSDLRPQYVMMYGFPPHIGDSVVAFQGELRTSVSGPGAHPYIEFFCPDLEAAFHRASRRAAASVLTPHEVWKGISGGPVVAVDSISHEPQYVVGVLTMIAPSGVAKRVRCAPTSVLRELCPKARLYLETVAPPKQEEHRIRSWVGSALVGLDDPRREQVAWLQISNAFFKDRSILYDLTAAISNPAGFGLVAGELPFVHYFLGRLYQKAGSSDEAVNHFRHALATANRLPEPSRVRLRTLIQARTLDAQPLGATQSWQGPLFRVRHDLEELKDAPQEYVALELASVVGYQSTRLFLSASAMAIPERAHLLSLADDHEQLLPLISTGRSNQEVVSTALRVFSTIWITEDRDRLTAGLQKLTTLGFAQAKANRNSIFHIQMLLTRAIMRWHEGSVTPAMSLSLLAGQMLVASELTLRHEGIAQLFGYVQQRCPDIAACMEAATVRNGSAPMPDKVVAIGGAAVTRRPVLEAVSASEEAWEAVRQSDHYFNLDTGIYDDI